MSLPNFINTVAPEPSLARWTSLINNQPQPFPVVFYGDTKAMAWYFHNNGTIESFSGGTGYSLKVTLGNVDAGPTGGEYTLTCGETSDALAWNADAETIAGALNSLPTVIAFGGVNVQGVFPNFRIYSNDIGAVTSISTDASLLSPDSTAVADILTTGDASTRQQTLLSLRRGLITQQTNWTPVTGPAGWTGSLEMTGEAAAALLAEFGEVVGGYLQAETQLTAEVIKNSDSTVTAYYQTTVLFRGKNSDFTGVITPPSPPYTLGDILYGNAQGGLSKLPGNTSGTLKVLTQTGDGVNSAVPAWQTESSLGVTSVALALPSDLFTVSDSPVTSTGTLTGTVKTQVANTVWAGPTTGADANPAFRSLVLADLPGNIPSVSISVSNDDTTNATMYPLWATANTGTLPVYVSSGKMSFNPSTGRLTSTAATLGGIGMTANSITNASTLVSQALNPLLIGTGTFGTSITLASATGIPTFSTDVVFSGVNLSVPDAFNVSSAGSISLTAGSTAKNISLIPSTTGVVVCSTNYLLSAAAGNFRTLQITSGGGTNYRWLIGANNTAEGGTNAGSNFEIRAYDDAGAFLSSSLSINRSTGDVNLASATASTTTTSGALKVAGGLGVAGDIFAANATATGATVTNITSISTAASSGSSTVRTFANSSNVVGTVRSYSATSGGSTMGVTNTSTVNFLASGSSALGVMFGATTNIPAYFGINNAEIFRLTGTTLRMSATNLLTFGGTSLSTIGVSADTTAGILQLISPTSGTITLTTANALSLTLSGGAAATITGAAGNMTVTAGTGNSRTLTLRTTTSGGTATAALTLDATQGGTFGGSITTSAPNGGTAAAWKLGTVVTGITATMVTTNYIQLDVAGTLYKLATVTSVP